MANSFKSESCASEMSSKALKLYYFPHSAPCRIALLTCRYLGLDVEVIHVDLGKKEQLKDEFMKINPQHVVPTLDDNGFILWESRTIATYLVETYAPDSQLYPKSDTKKRALISQRLHFDCGTVHVKVRQCAHPLLLFGATVIPESAKQGIRDIFALLEVFLKDSEYLAGNELTLADISIYCTLSSIVQTGADIKPYPLLSAWYKKMEILPGWDENEKGSKLFAQRLWDKMTEPY